MSIEVTGYSRPGKPNLAIVVSGLLLIATLAGAAALTYIRNRPISLTTVQNVPAVRDLRMAWPASWAPLRLPGGAGPAIAGVAEGTGRSQTDKILFLLEERVSDTYVSPKYAGWHMLQTATKQLGFLGVSERFVSGTGEMLGRPAFQMKFQVYFRQRAHWAVLRVASEPNGMAIGLLLLSGEQMSPSVERIVEQVAGSMQLQRKSLDVAAALGIFKLTAKSADNADIGRLRGYLREMPAAGPVGVTFVPEGRASAEQYYAIDLWTSWLANRRTPQDLACTWYRRNNLEADPPSQGGWIQRGNSRIWKLVISERAVDTDTLVDTLYLKELPDRRVVWARTTAGAGASPEDVVVDLLASVQTTEEPGWKYDTAIAAAGTLLAGIADGPVERYYQTNRGRQGFTYTGVNGQKDGTGLYITAIQPDGTLTRGEQIAIGPEASRLKSEKTALLKSDLSAFQVKDLTQYGSERSLRVDSGRSDAGSPVNVVMQFSHGAPIQASFRMTEPFLPDPAVDAAALQLSRKQGAAAMFRTVGADPEVPESLLMVGLGRQQIQVAGRQIDALACLLQEDTDSGPSVRLFDEGGRLLGYVLPGGAALLRNVEAVATEPAAEAD